MTTHTRKSHHPPSPRRAKSPRRAVHRAPAIIRHGRLVLFGSIVLGFATACAVVLWFLRTGALSWDPRDALGRGVGAKEALEHLVAAYSPALGIIAAYYFGEGHGPSHRTASHEAFYFALVVTMLTSWLPPIALLVVSPTANALDLLRSFATFSQALSSGALTFYFVKGLKGDAAPLKASEHAAAHRTAPARRAA